MIFNFFKISFLLQLICKHVTETRQNSVLKVPIRAFYTPRRYSLEGDHFGHDFRLNRRFYKGKMMGLTKI